MRIIHTADWHLCNRLGRVDRTRDLRTRVEAVAGLCDTHRADVLVIAGDLFCDGATVDEMGDALEHLHATFNEFFARGGTVVGVTGNHDREARVGLVRHGMRLADPGGGRRFEPGRMYLLSRPGVGALTTAAGEGVQFVLVPYPTAVRYLSGEARHASAAELNRALNAEVVRWLTVTAPPLCDPKLPTVLVGHLHVTGAGLTHSLYRLTEADDVVFDGGFRPGWVQYVALGHIHKRQALGGSRDVWYSGSLDRLDFGERDDDKGVVVVDVGRHGLVGEPQPLPLPVPTTPMYRVELTGTPDELDGLAGRVPEVERWTALVQVTAAYAPGGPTRDEITRAVRQAFPRLVDLSWTRPEPAAGGSAGCGVVRPTADHRATVRDYLSAKLAADPDRDALLALAETFLTEDGR